VKQDEQKLGEYFQLIKKITNWKIKDPNHHNIREDVASETFLKLFKQDFFNKYDFYNEDHKKLISSYIYKTVWSCYMDQLQLLGFNRRLTKNEREMKGQRYENINTNPFEDVAESDEALHDLEGPDQYIVAKEAYQWVKSCFESLALEISNIKRRQFFYAVFWEFSDYGMPMKKLALHLGYESSNPTQELKRFTEKVSLCTRPYGVVVTNPHEQIQFLQEQIENFEVDA